LEGRFSIEIVEATKMSKNNWNLKTWFDVFMMVLIIKLEF
jgi:hypothetical protein